MSILQVVENMVAIISFLLFFVLCCCCCNRHKSVNNVTLQSRGGGPLGRQTEKEREKQREGVGCFRAQGRGLESSPRTMTASSI